jgi:hypothetical protein
MKTQLSLISAFSLIPSLAVALTIDVNGASTPGGVISDVQVLDWAPGNAIILGGSAAHTGDVVTVLTQTRLNAFPDSTTNSVTDTGLGLNYEITFVSRFDELIYNAQTILNPVTGKVSSVTNFTSINPENSFFEIWIDSNPLTASNMLAGTGFNDGILLASGYIQPGGDGNMSSSFAYSGNPNQPISSNPQDYPALDQFMNNDYAAIRTNIGVGGSLFTGLSEFEYINKDYIIDWTGDMVIQLNSSQTLPFRETDPSSLFVSTKGGAAPTQPGVSSVGLINGASGGNVMIQVDSNNSFLQNPFIVPIVNTFSLLIIGFGSLAVRILPNMKSKANEPEE